ncbi:MAG: rRNA maturation RNase YbeY [Actinomycetota bacterium]
MIPRATPRVHGADEQTAVSVDLMHWVRLAEHVLRGERAPDDAEMALVFVDRETIADLNVRYLGGSGPTDVLAFPLEDEIPVGRMPDQGGRGPGSSSDPPEPPMAIGDVLVCPDVARAQAEERGVPVEDELALLVVHGTLHIFGYDHADPDDQARMQRRERDLLTSFRVGEDPRPSRRGASS